MAALAVMLQRSMISGRALHHLHSPSERNADSQNLRRISRLWITFEQFSELGRKSLTGWRKFASKLVDNPVGRF